MITIVVLYGIALLIVPMAGLAVYWLSEDAWDVEPSAQIIPFTPAIQQTVDTSEVKSEAHHA